MRSAAHPKASFTAAALLVFLATVTLSFRLPARGEDKGGFTYQLALPGRKLSFPADHFSHPNFKTEWWYYTGNLDSQDGRHFGYQLTFFRQAIKPGEASNLTKALNLTPYSDPESLLIRKAKRDEKDISASLEQIMRIVSETLDQATQGKAEAGSQPSFKFHPGANLFIVIGSPQAIEVTEKVVNALPGVAGARGYPPQNAETRLMDDAFRRRYGLEPRSGSPTTVPTPASPAKR